MIIAERDDPTLNPLEYDQDADDWIGPMGYNGWTLAQLRMRSVRLRGVLSTQKSSHGFRTTWRLILVSY